MICPNCLNEIENTADSKCKCSLQAIEEGHEFKKKLEQD